MSWPRERRTTHTLSEIPEGAFDRVLNYRSGDWVSLCMSACLELLNDALLSWRNNPKGFSYCALLALGV